MADIKVRVGQQNSVKVVSSFAAAGTLRGLVDVNLGPEGSLLDGMVLVYNSSTEQWDATLTLTPGTTQNLDINGGSF